MLGAPVVNVELTCAQIEFCVEMASKKWEQYQGVNKTFSFFETTPRVNEYNIEDINSDIKKPYTEFILDVIYEPNEINYADDGFYLLVNQFYFYYAYNNKQLMSDYNLFQGYIEDLKRTLGTNGTYEIYGDKLILAPMPRAAVKALIIYKAGYEDDVLDNNQWVMRYSLALAKGILGQTRGKFAGGLTGTSGALTFNASDLLSQSAAEIELLLKELIQRAGPVGIVTG
jgi:hypothetical protein